MFKFVDDEFVEYNQKQLKGKREKKVKNAYEFIASIDSIEKYKFRELVKAVEEIIGSHLDEEEKYFLDDLYRDY